MGAFGGIILTNKGRNLQAKAQTGIELKYTRMAIGDGQLSGQSIPTMTKLISEKKSLPLTKLKLQGQGRVVVGAVLSNQDVTTGFYFRELGVFARDPDEGEILYGYGNSGTSAEFIPPAGGEDIIEKSIDINVIVGQAPNVSAVIDSSLVWATQDDVTAAVAEAKEYTDIQIQDIASKLTPEQIGAASKAEFDAHTADYIKHPGFAVSTGTNNAYIVTLDPAPSTYAQGMGVAIAIHVNSTAAATLNVNGLGTKKILKANGGAATNLKANGIYTLRYNTAADGGNGAFILQGEGGEYGTASVSDVLAGKTIGTEDGIKTGTMPDNGALAGSITTQSGSYAIAKGYHNGSGKVTANITNLTAANILKGKVVGGITGTGVNGKQYAKVNVTFPHDGVGSNGTIAAIPNLPFTPTIAVIPYFYMRMVANTSSPSSQAGATLSLSTLQTVTFINASFGGATEVDVSLKISGSNLILTSTSSIQFGNATLEVHFFS